MASAVLIRKAARKVKPTHAIIAPTFGEPSTDVYRNMSSIAHRLQEAYTVLVAPLGGDGLLSAIEHRQVDTVVAGLDWVGFVQQANRIITPIRHTLQSFGRLEVTPPEKQRAMRKALAMRKAAPWAHDHLPPVGSTFVKGGATYTVTKVWETNPALDSPQTIEDAKAGKNGLGFVFARKEGAKAGARYYPADLNQLPVASPGGIITPPSVGAHTAGGPHSVVTEVPLDPKVLSKLFADIDQRAIDYAHQHAGKLIVAVTEDTKAQVRVLLEKALQGDLTTPQLARQLRDFVPLLPAQSASVAKIYAAAYKNAQEAWAAKNGGVPAASVVGGWSDAAQKIASKAAASKLAYRTTNIARTEVVAASNRGRYAAWQSQVASGVAASNSLKQWVAAGDACEECLAIDGETIAWDDTFSSGDDMPPDHPSCRCSAVLLPPDYDGSDTEATYDGDYVPQGDESDPEGTDDGLGDALNAVLGDADLVAAMTDAFDGAKVADAVGEADALEHLPLAYGDDAVTETAHAVDHEPEHAPVEQHVPNPAAAKQPGAKQPLAAHTDAALKEKFATQMDDLDYLAGEDALDAASLQSVWEGVTSSEMSEKSKQLFLADLDELAAANGVHWSTFSAPGFNPAHEAANAAEQAAAAAPIKPGIVASQKAIDDLLAKAGPGGEGIGIEDVKQVEAIIQGHQYQGDITPLEAKELKQQVTDGLKAQGLNKISLGMASKKGVKLGGALGHTSPSAAAAATQTVAQLKAEEAAAKAAADAKAASDAEAADKLAKVNEAVNGWKAKLAGDGVDGNDYFDSVNALMDTGMTPTAANGLLSAASGGLTPAQLTQATSHGVKLKIGASAKPKLGTGGIGGKAGEQLTALEQKITLGGATTKDVADANNGVQKIPGLAQAKKDAAKDQIKAILAHHESALASGGKLGIGEGAAGTVGASTATNLAALDADHAAGLVSDAEYAKIQPIIETGVSYVPKALKDAITFTGDAGTYGKEKWLVNDTILKLHTGQHVSQADYAAADTAAKKLPMDAKTKLTQALHDSGHESPSALSASSDPYVIAKADPEAYAHEILGVFADSGLPSKDEYAAAWNALGAMGYSTKVNAIKQMLADSLSGSKLAGPDMLPLVRQTSTGVQTGGARLFFSEKDRRAYRDSFAHPATKYTAAEKKAIKEYTRGVSFTISPALRKDAFTGMSKYGHHYEADDVFKGVDALMAKSITTEDAVVYRGVTSGAFESGSAGLRDAFLGSDPHAFVGKVLTDKAFMSTSMNRAVLPGFRGNASLEITVPKGSAAIYARDHSAFADSEVELLLDRGSKMVVTSATKVGGRWDIKVTLIDSANKPHAGAAVVTAKPLTAAQKAKAEKIEAAEAGKKAVIAPFKAKAESVGLTSSDWVAMGDALQAAGYKATETNLVMEEETGLTFQQLLAAKGSAVKSGA